MPSHAPAILGHRLLIKHPSTGGHQGARGGAASSISWLKLAMLTLDTPLVGTVGRTWYRVSPPLRLYFLPHPVLPSSLAVLALHTIY